jgi:hypothetical protein
MVHSERNYTPDTDEKRRVITVSVETIGGTCLATYHAREDGTFTQKTTPAGEKAARAAAPPGDGRQ